MGKSETVVTLSLGSSYGSLALFTAILNNVFLLYHVETFVSVYKIDKTSFWIGEMVFLIWNSFNDPLFGWISDHMLLNSSNNGATYDIILKRLNALSWNGPLFGLSFLLFWISWMWPSVQFVVCLCLYDGFLTVIDLHRSALLADFAVSADTRTRLSTYSSAFNTIGALSVFLSYAVWNRQNMMSFQLFCASLAAFSIIGFMISTMVLKKLHFSNIARCGNYALSLKNVDDGNVTMQTQKGQLKQFIKELASHKNFVWFSVMNLVQVFHCHFNSNFFPLFLENLLGDAIPAGTGSVLLGLSFVVPHINNMYFLTLCRRYGVYNIIKFLFVVKLVLSAVMWMLGPNNLWVLCFFIASNRVFTEGTCKLLDLVISDLVDEDYVLHNRSQAVSALIFGTAALLSKPGQTFAPLIGTFLISSITGHDIFQSGNELGSIKIKDISYEETQTTRSGCFYLLVYIPVACAIIQLIAWSQFSLHGKRLCYVKSVRAGSREHEV